jgi:hypothetical protein
MGDVPNVVVGQSRSRISRRWIKFGLPVTILVACLALGLGLALHHKSNPETKPLSAAQKAAATLKSDHDKAAAAAKNKPTEGAQLQTYQSQIDAAEKAKKSSAVLLPLYENAAFLAASMHNDAAKGYAQKALALLPTDATTKAAYAGLYANLEAYSQGDYSNAQ